MRTKQIRVKHGRLIGTVQSVPVAVADRLLATGQADPVDDASSAVASVAQDEIRTNDPPVAHRDPRDPKKARR